MSYVALGQSSISSQTRPSPTRIGFEWTQVNSAGFPIERWTWNGSVYLGGLQQVSWPDTWGNYSAISASTLIAILMPINQDILIEKMLWAPYCYSGTYNDSNYWNLSLILLGSTTGGNSTTNYRLVSNQVLAAPQRFSVSVNLTLSVSASLSRAVALFLDKIGNPPEVYPGAIILQYRNRTT